MNRTLVALWAIIVGAIMSLVAFVVVYNHQRESDARLGLATLLRQQLEPYNREIAELFDGYERELFSRLASFDPNRPTAVTELERSPLIGLAVVVSDEGAKARLLYPDLNTARPEDRSLILDAVTWLRDSNFTLGTKGANARAQPVPPLNDQQPASWPTQAAQSQAAQSQAAQSQAAQSQAVQPQAPSSRSLWPTKISSLYRSGPAVPFNSGNVSADETNWTTWYHGRGMVLGYWTQTPGQTLTMVLVPRGRWLADLISVLPDNSQGREDALLQLIDVEGNIITQWGDLDLPESAGGDAELPVGEPLDGWRLRLHLSPQAAALALQTDTRWLSALVALAASSTLLLLGTLISLSINRQLRQAAQQVSFVNQVSHELRTPLTNIRMYTDLALQNLEQQASEAGDENLSRLNVVQQEASRLGRLIENVLSYARSGHAQRPLKAIDVPDVDRLIDAIVETFRPQLDELAMTVTRTRGASQAARIDRDVFEQILVNLISNALKYAASGKLLRIDSELVGERLTIRVIDAGPGIARRLRERIFQPFVRLSNRLEDPTGTGIGLTIARQLARHHGGDCTLAPEHAPGCCFTFTIRSVT